MKSTVTNCLICWTRGTNSSWEKMQKLILMWLDFHKFQSVLFNNFNIYSRVVAHKESPLKTPLIASLPDPMPSYKFPWKMEKKASEKFTSSIWLVMSEAPTIWTWKNKLKSMVRKSTSHCFSWKSVFVVLIKEKIMFHSEAPNSQCASKTLSLDSAAQSWLVTSLLHRTVVKTH